MSMHGQDTGTHTPGVVGITQQHRRTQAKCAEMCKLTLLASLVTLFSSTEGGRGVFIEKWIETQAPFA
jgi:hypothetical protein